MINAAVARRYAKALLNAADEAAGGGGATDPIADELEALAATIDRFNGLALLVQNPVIDGARKTAVLVEVAERLGAGDLTKRFIGVLAQHQRLDHLQAVAGAYRALADERRGVVNAEITSPGPLSDQETTDLRERLAQATSSQVRLNTKTDPELLGGLVTRIGDRIYDGSLRYQLDRMRGQMTKT